MKIAIDGYNLSLERGTGIATYARNLSHALHEAGHEVHVLYGAPRVSFDPPTLRQIALFDHNVEEDSRFIKRIRARWRQLSSHFGLTAQPVSKGGMVITEGLAERMPYSDSLWNIDDLFASAHYFFTTTGKFLNVRLPEKVDVAHWTFPMPIRMEGAVNIYTVHDVIPLRMPYTTMDNKSSYMRLLQAIAERADHVVTVSENSLADIETYLPAAKGRVTNLSQTIQIPAKLLERDRKLVDRDVAGKFGLTPGRYFLFCGSIEPKKNIGRLLEAHLTADTQMPLVIVSAQAWKSEGELRLIRELEVNLGAEAVSRFVIRLEYVSFENLISLIRAARAVTFPSLYEGFGLPVLEAMMCGTPVITSNIAPLNELATANSAVLVDPYDVDSIARALERLANDDPLCERLGREGAARAERFGWNAYVERVRRFYGSDLARR